MAITIEEELIEGVNCLEDSNGVSVMRHFLVKGMPSTRHLLLDARLATDSVTGDKIPVYGQPHPDDSSLFARIIQPKPILNSRTDAHVYVTYNSSLDFSNVSSPKMTFYGSTREVLSNYDADFDVINVGYASSGANVSLPDQIGEARGTKALGVLEAEWVSFVDPAGLQFYLNKVSSATWRGYPKYAWLCSNFEVEKLLYRAGWNVRMGFQLDEELFTHVEFYRLDPGGIIPSDIDTPVNKSVLGQKNGYTVTLQNHTANFNAIGLPNGFGS